MPSPIYGYDGHFSNGAVWADIAAALLGVEAGETVNYAVGGAHAVGTRSFEDSINDNGLDPLLLAEPDTDALAFELNLAGQVQRFLADTAVNGVPDGAAASLFIGLNDFAAFEPTSPATAYDEAVALIGQMVNATLTAAYTLAQAGVETIILNTLPPASFFPLFQYADPVQQALGDLAVAGFNAALTAGAAALEAGGVNVEIVDLNAIASEVMADQHTFGFLDIAHSEYYLTGADPFIVDLGFGPFPYVPEDPAVDGLDPDQIAFWDLQHPSTALHGVFGAFTEASLTSEVSVLGSGDDLFGGTSADELVLAGAGDDTLSLGNGDDVVLGGLGDDSIDGGKGLDILSGGGGDDVLNGGRASDVLAGGNGDDVMDGGADGDALIDGLGSDLMLGGKGDDFFFFTEAALIGGVNGADTDVFVGGSGYDTLYLALDAGTRATVEAAFDGLEGGAAVFDLLGLSVSEFEEVVFLDGRGLPDETAASPELAAMLVEADYWGFA